MKRRLSFLLCIVCLAEVAWCSLPWTGSETLSEANRLNIGAGEFQGCQIGDMIDVTISGVPASDSWIDINGWYFAVAAPGEIHLMVDEKIANELDDQGVGLNICGTVTVSRVGYRKVNKSRIICAGSGMRYSYDVDKMGATPFADDDCDNPKTDMSSDIQVGDRILINYDYINENSKQLVKLGDKTLFSSVMPNYNNGIVEMTLYDGPDVAMGAWKKSITDVGMNLFKNAAVGDVIRVYIKDKTGDAGQQAVAYRVVDESFNWVKFPGEDVDNVLSDDEFATGYVDLVITQNILSQLQTRKFIVGGGNYTATKITLIDTNNVIYKYNVSGQGSVVVKETLYDEPDVAMGDWKNSINKIDKSLFKNAAVGDVVRVYIASPVGNDRGINLINPDASGWVDIASKNLSDEDFNTGYYDMVLDADKLAKVKANGLVVAGKNYTAVKVELRCISNSPCFMRYIIDVTNDNINELKTNNMEYHGAQCALVNAFLLGSSYTEHNGGGTADTRAEGAGNSDIRSAAKLDVDGVDVLYTGPKTLTAGSYNDTEKTVSFAPSVFADYRIGDTLFVYTSNEKTFAEGALRSRTQDAGDRMVTREGIVSKMDRYLVKGSYFQVLDEQMLNVIKSDGLVIAGKGHKVEYVAIRKGGPTSNTQNDDHTGNRFTGDPTKIAENVNSSSVEISYDKLYNNGTYHAYWGDVIYVETDGTQGNTCTISINGTQLTAPRKCNDDFVMHLTYDDKNKLIAPANDGQDIKVTLSEGEIKNVYLVKETRQRNSGDLTAAGEIDWTRAKRVLVNNLGNVEVGDQITITGHTIDTERNSQLSLQIMHFGEYDTKGLAYIVNHGYHDIYDRLTYDGSKEWKEFISSNYEEVYEVPTSSMAEALRNNTFMVTGSNFYVDKVHVNSKSFVYPQTVSALQYATMCAPYNIEMPTDDAIRAYAITGIQEKSLILTRVYNIPMGAAVVLFKDAGVNETNFKLPCFDSISLTAEEETAFANNLLIGDIVNKKVQNNDDYTYYMLAYKKPNDKPNKEVAFFRIEGEVTAGAYKGYLRLPNSVAPAGAKSFSFIFNDEFSDPFSETTDINTIGQLDNLQSDDNVYYDLSGRKIVMSSSSNGKLPKGIYIHNNKKVIIK